MSWRVMSATAWWGGWFWLLISAGAITWGWQVGPAYLAWNQAGEALQHMEQRVIQADMGAAPAEVAVPDRAGLAAFAHATLASNGTHHAPGQEGVLLAQWQALLKQHHLTGWQGRLGTLGSVATAAQAVVNPAGPGAVWRLEGPATYVQGVALLQSLAQAMPGVVLIQVQARQRSDGPLLDWLLKWQRADGPVAPRWAARWPAVQAVAMDPFALARMQPVGSIGSPSSDDTTSADLVLPQVPLHEVQLAGIVSGPQEERALITSRATPHHAFPEVAHPPRAWHSLRVGQRVGLERAKVVAIEDRRVTLQTSRRRHEARGELPERPVVLELASVTPSPLALPLKAQP